jgi:hypothetical protein
MIHLLIYIIILALIVGLAIYVIRAFVPDPLARMFEVVVYVVAVIIIIILLLGLVGQAPQLSIR